MFITTSRFGEVSVQADDLFTFPQGLIGMEHCRRWVLLSEAENESIGWLQSENQPDTAIAVVSPRRFLPDYQVRVTRGQLACLKLSEDDQTFVLNVLAKTSGHLTVNLKAPLIINLSRRLGCQVVTSDDQPVQYELTAPSLKMRKSA